MELAYDSELSGQPGSRRVIKDRLGRIVEDVKAVVPPVDGQDLSLSIDAGMQFDAYSALKKALEEHQAKSGAAIVVDVQTGEILALVNLPTYDPNDRDDRKGSALRNGQVTVKLTKKQATKLGKGTWKATATYAGDASFTAATSTVKTKVKR